MMIMGTGKNSKLNTKKNTGLINESNIVE